ncbi:MAG TPA: thermonuclease family protein [Nitriliruptorales bacterium]|nr:thermonuclease family protein [Nitriliruptorales bacterium]
MRSRDALASVLAIAIVVALGACSREERGPTTPFAAQPAVVEDVLDGDSLLVRIEGGEGPLEHGTARELALSEIDAPEAEDPAGNSECWGAEAARFAEETLPVGSTVYVVPAQFDPPAEGRLEAFVYTKDNVFFNQLAVTQGHARSLAEVFVVRLGAAQSDAQERDRGMWGPPCDYQPSPSPSPPAEPSPAAS